jgi:hypothetical protein
MKKILTLVLFLVVTLTLAGCDYRDPELIDQIKDIAADYCEENPDDEYCNLDYEAELEKIEVELTHYFEDYSNGEYSNQEIADMYFEGIIPEGFEEQRNMDVEDGIVLSLESIGFRLDGGFDISYTAYQDGEDLLLRKRPGRIKFDAEAKTATIVWYDGLDNDCDGDCEALEDVDKTKETLTAYFEDYMNPEVSNQDLANKYYGGRVTDEFAMQRDKDLADGVVFTIVDVMERDDDDFFDITYQMGTGDDLVVRKRPGRTTYKNGSNLINWDGVDQDCDGVDDDCN